MEIMYTTFAFLLFGMLLPLLVIYAYFQGYSRGVNEGRNNQVFEPGWIDPKIHKKEFDPLKRYKAIVPDRTPDSEMSS
jgi:hypothetical protein